MSELVQVEHDALALDVKSRAKLALRLLKSLDDISEADNERIWLEEVERRRIELESGEVEAIPIEDVLRDARSSLL